MVVGMATVGGAIAGAIVALIIDFGTVKLLHRRIISLKGGKPKFWVKTAKYHLLSW